MVPLEAFYSTKHLGPDLECSVGSVVGVGEDLNWLLEHHTEGVDSAIRGEVGVIACTHLYKMITLIF